MNALRPHADDVQKGECRDAPARPLDRALWPRVLHLGPSYFQPGSPIRTLKTVLERVQDKSEVLQQLFEARRVDRHHQPDVQEWSAEEQPFNESAHLGSAHAPIVSWPEQVRIE